MKSACLLFLATAASAFGQIHADARRDGSAGAWAMLLLASVGAVACLFLGLMLIVRLSRALGITHTPSPRPKRDPAAPRGGKRASR